VTRRTQVSALQTESVLDVQFPKLLLGCFTAVDPFFFCFVLAGIYWIHWHGSMPSPRFDGYLSVPIFLQLYRFIVGTYDGLLGWSTWLSMFYAGAVAPQVCCWFLAALFGRLTVNCWMFVLIFTMMESDGLGYRCISQLFMLWMQLWCTGFDVLGGDGPGRVLSTAGDG
jgi:hypothetical protein